MERFLKKIRSLLFVWNWICCCTRLKCSSAFVEGEEVPLYVNKLGPFHNPSETYQYYKLPFCKPKQGIVHKWEFLGEVLEGDRMTTPPFDLKFRQDVPFHEVCTAFLSASDVNSFRDAILNDYYFQMFYDDLPLWGFVGKLVEDPEGKQTPNVVLFTHLHFDISYNGGDVIEVNVSTDPLKVVDITDGTEKQATFSYSATWMPTNTLHNRRMDKYTKYSFLPEHMEIHWFSILNSCMIVLLLMGVLALIFHRTLKNDFLKYTSLDTEIPEEGESGWKLIHADVFRMPHWKNFFAAILGSGSQIFALSCCILFMSLIGFFYPYNRGTLLTACILLYSITACVSGYVSATMYRKMGGQNWANNVLLTICIFCVPLLVTFSILNTVAIFYRSTAALPFGTICIILVIWALVTFPLTVFGAIVGKNGTGDFDFPCRTSKYPRKVPPVSWYGSAPTQMLIAGILPFGAIYIELYYIFASIWGHKVYTVYSVISIMFMLLLMVTSFVTISLTYFQLLLEDWRWWWRSFVCGGSTGFFIFLYCFYFFYWKSAMTGLMQTSFFFGYMFLVSYAVFLMLGCVGFFSSFIFVKHIYMAIKCE